MKKVISLNITYNNNMSEISEYAQKFINLIVQTFRENVNSLDVIRIANSQNPIVEFHKIVNEEQMNGMYLRMNLIQK